MDLLNQCSNFEHPICILVQYVILPLNCLSHHCLACVIDFTDNGFLRVFLMASCYQLSVLHRTLISHHDIVVV